MAVNLSINGQTTEATEKQSLFDYAEQLGVQVPTSCHKQGKCKECLVEVVSGMECLSKPVEEEQHLKDSFRLSCRCHVVSESGDVRCHTLRRGHMRIEREALRLPVSRQELQLDPAVTRDGDRILIDGQEIDRQTGPIHGLAMDLGTTTVVLRLIDLETGQLVADTSFENPQRFGGSDVMSRILRHGESWTSIEAYAGRIPGSCNRGFPRRHRDDLRNGRSRQCDHARYVFWQKRLLDRPKPVSVHY